MTVCGRDSVRMPSCTVPMCSNSVDTSHMIQCEMPFRRSAIAVAAATAPMPTWPLGPEIERHAGGAGDQAHAEHVVGDLEATDESHLAIGGVHEFLHGTARVTRLAARVREQLDGRDVGIRVGDAARHQRARIGLRGAHLAEARHEIAQAHGVEREPAEERREHPQVETAHDQQHRDEVDRDEREDVRRGDPRIAHRQRRLHHLRGDAARELVLVEAHALAEHQPMEVPAQAHRKVGRTAPGI